MLEAYVADRRENSARTVMRGWLLTTHNDARRHWAGDKSGDTLRQPITEEYGKRVKDAVTRWKRKSGYIDAHAWQFTPDTFSHRVQLIYAAELSDMKVEAIYPTIRNTLEFYAVLKKTSTQWSGGESN